MRTKIYFQIKKKFFLHVLLLSVCFIFWNIASTLFINKFTGIKLGSENKFDSNLEAFFVAIVFAPIFETLLFQFLIIYQTHESYKGKYVKQLSIFISSVLFGLSHFYSIYYVLFALVAGYILATSFYYFKEKTNYLSAIFYITLVHLLSNLFVFIVKIYES
ncbi:type II CAAX prenyl endopeptidase Rce1 family protein [Flavobacterium sp.]|uniref:CPBP family glutamic-type intramembrane protease n=1 Tax=Flavobacterium sp. TaxID=239 RepID=UPI00374CCDB9